MSGKTNRKHGRGKRKPSNQRYTNEMRWQKNSKRRQDRHLKRVAKKARHLASRAARFKKVA